MKHTKEYLAATMIGGAIGDTLGMPIEAMNRHQIKKYVGRITKPIDPVIKFDENGKRLRNDEYGPLKGWTRDLKAGMYTDDTILSLALGESLNLYGENLQAIGENQLAAYLLRPQLDNGRRSGAFGGTTQKGFKRLEQGIPAADSGVIGGPGNAPAMKMGPYGIFMSQKGPVDHHQSYLFAHAIGEITHKDPRSLVSGVIQAAAVNCLLGGTSKEHFLDTVLNVCAKYELPVTDEFPLSEAGSMLQRLEWIKTNQDVSTDQAYETLGSSSVVFESYPFTLFMFQKNWDNGLEGLLDTVNYGGDCDTTGAMYGTLLGAKEGMIFPQAWLDVLQNKDRLEMVGKGMYKGT